MGMIINISLRTGILIVLKNSINKYEFPKNTLDETFLEYY